MLLSVSEQFHKMLSPYGWTILWKCEKIIQLHMNYRTAHIMPSYLTRSIVFIIPVIGCRILDSSSFVESYINDTFKLASLEAFYT